MDIYQSEHRGDLDERKAILAEIERQEGMLSNARKQIASNEIEADDFKAIKADCNKALKLMEDKLENLPSKNDSLRTIESLLDILVAKFSNIQMHFKKSSVIEKRKLIGSMYPKNLCFDGIGHRTPYLSEPLSLILQINKQLQCIKKGEKLSLNNLSPLVAPRGIEPHELGHF
jgi:site-specific DNA recombinase